MSVEDFSSEDELMSFHIPLAADPVATSRYDDPSRLFAPLISDGEDEAVNQREMPSSQDDFDDENFESVPGAIMNTETQNEVSQPAGAFGPCSLNLICSAMHQRGIRCPGSDRSRKTGVHWRQRTKNHSAMRIMSPQ